MVSLTTLTLAQKAMDVIDKDKLTIIEVEVSIFMGLSQLCPPSYGTLDVPPR